MESSSPSSETFRRIAGMTSDSDGFEIRLGTELSEEEYERLSRTAALVRQLADPRPLIRLDAAVQRARETLDDATAHGDERLSAGVDARIRIERDLIAIMRAIDVELARMGTVLDTYSEDSNSKQLLNELVDNVRSKPAYLIGLHLATQSDGGALTVSVEQGLITVDGRTPDQLSRLFAELAGFLILVQLNWRSMLRREFEAGVDRIESVTEDWMGGMPRLATGSVRESGPETTSITDLPMLDLNALRVYYASLDRATTPSERGDAAVELSNNTRDPVSQVGELDISHAIVGGGRFTTSMGDVPGANVTLDVDLLGSTPLDYWGQFEQLERRGGDGLYRVFRGAVSHARIDERRLELACAGAVDLLESVAGGTLAAGMSSEELIYSLSALVGVEEDDLPQARAGENLRPELEAFSIVRPLVGIEVSQTVPVGQAELWATGAIESVLQRLPDEDDLERSKVREFCECDSLLATKVSARFLHEAELEGVEVLETAVSWLAVRGRYGSVRLPDGRLSPFHRETALNVPRVAGAVLVFGGESERTWLRQLGGGGASKPQAIAPDSSLLSPALPANATSVDRYALSALRRAMSEESLDAQLQALWEAVEFYVSNVRTEKLFSKQERARIKGEGGTWMTSEQRKRFENAIDSLNSVSTLARLRMQLAEEGVPLSALEDVTLFDTLRKARNNRAHGTKPDPPSRLEILQGVGIVSRLLVYRAANRSGERGLRRLPK